MPKPKSPLSAIAIPVACTAVAWRCHLRVVLALLAVYFTLRIPFFFQKPVGEEGIFAAAFYNHPEPPNIGLIARVNGHEIYAPLEHPAPMYTVIGEYGRFITSFLNPQALTPANADVVVHGFFCLFQFAVWLLLVLCFTARDAVAGRWRPVALLLAVVATPLSVGGSLYLQVDTSSGVLFGGLVSLALVTISRTRLPGGVKMGLFVGACFLLGLVGKQEWSIALLATIGATAAFFLVFERRSRMRFILGILVAGGGACVLGNYFNYKYDPLNYMGGFDVLNRMSKGHTVLDGGAVSWSAIARQRMRFLFPFMLLALVALYCGFRAWRDRQTRDDVGIVCGLAFPFALFAPFYASSWNPADYRYFLPAFVALGVFLVGQLPRFDAYLPKWAFRGLVAILVLYSSPFLIYMRMNNLSITENQFSKITEQTRRHEERITEAKRTGTLPLVSTGLVYWRADVDFVGDAMGVEGLLSICEKFQRRPLLEQPSAPASVGHTPP